MQNQIIFSTPCSVFPNDVTWWKVTQSQVFGNGLRIFNVEMTSNFEDGGFDHMGKFIYRKGKILCDIPFDDSYFAKYIDQVLACLFSVSGPLQV